MTISSFIKKFNFLLTFCYPKQNNCWTMTPNATSVSVFFYWWLMTQRKLQRFWTPFLSVNSFQLLWKTCVRWCAWNRVFVSIATLQLLLRLALAVAILLRNDEPKASFGIDDTRGGRALLWYHSWIRAQIPWMILVGTSNTISMSLKNRKILYDAS